ncbi:MAG: AraC family transcriptional regulator [Gammaproteobacteria bacterium]|nr:AraC family transcriptional regulator [Gammaproteobacteria bacterium]
MKRQIGFALLLSFLLTAPLLAEPSFKELESRTRALKWQVLQLNQELLQLDEALRYPQQQRVTVFVALDIGFFFQLHSLQLKIDGVAVTTSDYSLSEREALKKGGVHRLYTANLAAGEYELRVIFYGLGPNNRVYQRAAAFKLHKLEKSQFVKVLIRDKELKQQPEFVISQW